MSVTVSAPPKPPRSLARGRAQREARARRRREAAERARERFEILASRGYPHQYRGGKGVVRPGGGWGGAFIARGSRGLPPVDPGGPPEGQGEMRSSLTDSRYGLDMTVTFDQEYFCGRYINGDWWIYAPSGVTIISYSPAWDGAARIHGAEVARNPGSLQGFDGRQSTTSSAIFPGWDPARRASIPAFVSPGQTFWQSRSQLAGDSGGSGLVNSFGGSFYRPGLRKIALFTVVDAVPPEGSFRPSPFGSSTKVAWNRLDYESRWSLLPSLALPSEADIVGAEGAVTKDWIFGWGSPDANGYGIGWRIQYHHPVLNGPNYGRIRSELANKAAIHLLFNYTQEQKRPVLEAALQHGIDAHGAIEGGWTPGWCAGGLQHGFELQIFLAGLMFDHSPYKEFITGQPTELAKGSVCQLHNQIYFPTQEELPAWSEHKTNADGATIHDNRFEPKIDVAGEPHWVNRTGPQPQFPGKLVYQRTDTTRAWIGAILMTRILGIHSWWGKQGILDHADWWAYQADTRDEQYRFLTPVVRSTWFAHRANYGAIYTAPTP